VDEFLPCLEWFPNENAPRLYCRVQTKSRLFPTCKLLVPSGRALQEAAGPALAGTVEVARKLGYGQEDYT
jgi:hypothetical protein